MTGTFTPRAWWREPRSSTPAPTRIVGTFHPRPRPMPMWMKVWGRGALLGAVGCTLWVMRTLHQAEPITFHHVLGFVMKLVVAMPVVSVLAGCLAWAGYGLLLFGRWLVRDPLESDRAER